MTFFKGKTSIVRIIFGITLALILTALIAGGIWYYRRLKDPVLPAQDALPANPAYVIRIKNVTGFWDELSKTSSIWKALADISWFGQINAQIRSIDSALSQHQDIEEIVADRELIIGGYLTAADQIEQLFLMNLSTAHDDEDADGLIKELAGENAVISTSEQGRYTITSVSRAGSVKQLYYSIPSGIFIAGFSKQLVADALTTLEKGTSAMKTPALAKLSGMAGKNSEANIFISTASIPALLAPFRSDSVKQALDFMTCFGGWTELDLKTKKCEWILSGYVQTGNDEPNFLNAFSRQTPGRSALDNSLPFNSGIVLKYRFDDFAAFYQDYAPRTIASGSDSVIDRTEKQFGLNIRDNFFDWISDEIALVVTIPGTANITDNTFAVFHTINPEKAVKALSAIHLFGSNYPQAVADSSDEVNLINAPGLIPALFGRVFANIRNTWYIRVNDNIVFGNSPGSLRDFRSSVLSGKSLDRNKNYASFAANLAEKSNLCLYVNIRKCFNILRSFAGSELATSMEKNKFVFRNFEALGLQSSADNTGIFYASLYLKFNPMYDDENPAIWETSLDTSLYCSPSVITDIRDSSKKIVAFDVQGRIYLLNDTGQILWKKQLKVKPVSDVWLVDTKNKNGYCIAFCTADKLWMLDMNGRTVAPYPVKLPVNAAGQVRIFDPDNRKQYMFIYQGTNKKMISINITGSSSKGWNSLLLKSMQAGEIRYHKTGNKEYFVFWDQGGTIYFTDRTGKPNLKIRQPFKKSAHAAVFTDDIQQGSFITTDEKGRIATISTGGNVTFTSCRTFTKEHYFLFADMNSDNEKDYIFIDNNAVFVYNRESRLLFTKELQGEIMNVAPVCFPFGTSNMLAAVAPANEHLILLNSDGLYDELQKYTATTSPVTAVFHKGEPAHLISICSKYIRCYRIVP